jgi:hypothetical protein
MDRPCPAGAAGWIAFSHGKEALPMEKVPFDAGLNDFWGFRFGMPSRQRHPYPGSPIAEVSDVRFPG